MRGRIRHTLAKPCSMKRASPRELIGERSKPSREVGVRRVPDYAVAPRLRVAVVAQDHRSRVVHDDLGRHATEVPEGVLVALEDGAEPLVREGLRVESARVE